MQLRFIPAGTRLDVQVSLDGSRAYTEEILFGTFVDTYNDLLFSIECPQLLKQSRVPEEGDFVRFTFFRGAESYTFEGKLSSIDTDFGKTLLYINAVSPIEKASRRKSQRIQVSLPAALYIPAGDQNNMPGEFSCQCTTFDISAQGLCLLSNTKLDLRHGSDFVIEIRLPSYDPFIIPAKHIRTGNCPQLMQYRHDHAFGIDSETSSSKIYNLTLAIFQLKLEGRL
ncbi:MAG: PilZ domain-containing protein [Defluviitaleaceae bacterium]|nr:PilZ domain-containing protein [Defluviitaleaceae bacterium]